MTPSHARSVSIASAYSARERSASVSSKRRMKRPPCLRANSALMKRGPRVADVDAPVGDGAKRTVGLTSWGLPLATGGGDHGKHGGGATCASVFE